MTAAKRYVDLNKLAGLTQVSLWVPAHNVDTILTLADNMRLNHYNDAIRKGKDQVIKALAMRNKRKLPSLPSFADAFHNVGSCMRGGFKHDEAVMLYDGLTACIHEYIDLEAELKKRGPDYEKLTINAKLYMLSNKAHALRDQIEVLAHTEANLPL